MLNGGVLWKALFFPAYTVVCPGAFVKSGFAWVEWQWLVWPITEVKIHKRLGNGVSKSLLHPKGLRLGLSWYLGILHSNVKQSGQIRWPKAFPQPNSKGPKLPRITTKTFQEFLRNKNFSLLTLQTPPARWVPLKKRTDGKKQEIWSLNAWKQFKKTWNWG